MILIGKDEVQSDIVKKFVNYLDSNRLAAKNAEKNLQPSRSKDFVKLGWCKNNAAQPKQTGTFA